MNILQKIHAEIKAGRLAIQQVAPGDLPNWFFNAIDWYHQPPAVFVTDADFIFESHQIGGAAFFSENEMVIFSCKRGQNREITLAHETAHFLVPPQWPSHGVTFLAEFGRLLLATGLAVDEVAENMHACVQNNWNKFCPLFLKSQAVKKAMKIVLEGGALPGRERGWVHLLSGSVAGRLHHRTSVLISLFAAAGVLVGWLAGPAAGVAAGVAVVAALLVA